jgi:hypothetical protein
MREDLHERLRTLQARYDYLMEHPFPFQQMQRLENLARAISEVKNEIVRRELDWRTCGF